MIRGVNTSLAGVQTYGNPKKAMGSGTAEKNLVKDEQAAILELGRSTESTAPTYSKPAPVKTGNSPDKAEEGKEKAGAAGSEEVEDNGGKTWTVDAKEINRLWDEANKATQNLRDLVEKLLKSQGKTFEDVLSGKEELIVDEETRAAAAEAISDNGECGVQAVSDRIVAFAKAISNDNPEMYDKLMSAIDEGFAQAGKALGGQLPDICKKTREEIGRKMEEWKNGKSSSVEKSEDTDK